MPNEPTTESGYAVFNGSGTILWFTIRRTKQMAIAAYRLETGNGVPKPFKVKPVKVTHNGN
jgi:hypothetical protein